VAEYPDKKCRDGLAIRRYNIESDPVQIHDLHATMLHLLGIDHQQLTYKHQGRRYRLTDCTLWIVATPNLPCSIGS